MTKVRNRAVVSAWAENRAAESHTGALSTDGVSLFSYNLMIADTAGGKKVLKDYTANGTFGFQSQTTSCHVGLARLHADVIL